MSFKTVVNILCVLVGGGFLILTGMGYYPLNWLTVLHGFVLGTGINGIAEGDG